MTRWHLVYLKLKEHCPERYKRQVIDSADKCILYLYVVKRWTINAIAEQVKELCSFHTIRNRLVRLQVPRRTRGGPHLQRKKIVLTADDLRLSGKEVAVKYDISLGHAYRLLREATSSTPP